MVRKLLLIDLDGVLNTYKGSFDPDFIPYIRPDSKMFLSNLHKEYDLKLFTTRDKILASKWLRDNDLDKYFVDVTNTKKPCWLFIDDRCICFDGDFTNLYNSIKSFQPWYKE